MQNKTKRFFRLSCMMLLIAGVLTSSCKKKPDPDTDPDVAVNFAISNVGGSWPNQTTYIQGLENLDITNLTNANATELSNWGQMWTYKNMLFVTRSGAPATMFKYTFDSKGVAVESGRMVVPGANTFSTIQFVDDNKAYASVAGGLARLVVFDPTALQITGEVNLSSIQKPAANAAWYLGSAINGSNLFWGVQYSTAGASFDTAYVAVIDMNTNTVSKLLSDSRTCMVFAAGNATNGFVKDANGDIYVMGFGSSATSNQNAKAPSGVLRIKNGQTDFDPDYFFNLREATGNDCMGLYHFGQGLAFTVSMQDASDPWEFLNNAPNYKFHRLDLGSKTAYGEVPGLPAVFGSSASFVRKFDDQLYMNISSEDENAFYIYPMDHGTPSKKFTMDGTCTGLAKLN